MGRSCRLAFGAIAAALLAGDLAPGHLAGAAVLALAGIVLLHESGLTRRSRSFVPVAIGAAVIALRLAMVPASDGDLRKPPSGEGPWALVVRSTGSPRDGAQTATLETPDATTPAFAVAATLPRYPVVVPGDRVIVGGAIRPPPDSPYGAYLARIGAVGTLTSRTLELEPGPEDASRRLERLRRTAAEALALVLPEPEAGLAAGILIGLRDLVDRDLAAAFTTAGVSHVVAISGWNIAIVAAAVAAAAGRLGRRRRSVLTVVAIAAYVVFAGASASVVRAALMAGVVLLARETGRAGRAAAALGWAAVLLLLTDPGLVHDAGFQLSSLATAGLIAWGTPLTERIHAAGRGRLPRFVSESLGVSLAAQAATLPVILASFGRLAVLSPLVNLAVVPLVAPAMAAGLVALAGGGIVLLGGPTVLGAVLAAPAWVMLRILVAIVDAAASVPFASLTLPSPFDMAAAAVTALAILAVASRHRLHAWIRSVRPAVHQPKRPANGESSPSAADAPTPRSERSTVDRATGNRAIRISAICLVVAVLITGGVAAARPSAVPRVSILDVGQGDAILVEGSRGGRLLIDGGPDPDRLLVALDRRVPPWDRRLDAVILSHPHEDHVAGLALLLDRYRVGRVFEPGMRGPGPGYSAWSHRLSQLVTVGRQGLAAGDRLHVDEIDFQVLWPIRGQVPAEPPDGGTSINNVSIVLLGAVAGRRMLLMGDVEQDVDPSLLRDRLPHVDLLKVAHHGSKTATTEPFVETVRPDVAVASAGAGNPYGHPAKATLDRLSAAGAKVYRTDRDGTVVAEFSRERVAVHAEGGRPVEGSRPVVALRATLASTHATSGKTQAFRCAVPVTGILPERDIAARPVATPGPASALARESPPVQRATVGYHRSDDGAHAGGGRLPAALPRSRTLAGSTRARRRGGRGLAGGAHRGQRHRRRPAAGRDGRIAPRRRQVAPAGRPGARPPSRRGLRGMAGSARAP
jgi:competence protein ComEC